MKNQLFRLLYNLRIHRLFKSAAVICLHRISSAKDPLFQPISPGDFEALVRALKKEYEITSFNEMRDRKKWRRPPLVISFDDGYKDFLEHAIPVIRKEGIVVNHNIVTSCADTGQLIWTQRYNNLLNWIHKTGQGLKIDFEDLHFEHQPVENLIAAKRRLFKLLFPRPYSFSEKLISELERKYSFMQPPNEMMNWDDIRTCEKEGTEIGSHTMYHGSFSEEREESYLKEEIIGSKKILESKLGHAIDSIAFPNGLVNPTAYNMATGAGYKNLLLIDDVKYSFKLGPNAYKRILVGHPSLEENIFNIAGFHKSLKGK